jgi:hypothetical protein
MANPDQLKQKAREAPEKFPCRSDSKPRKNNSRQNDNILRLLTQL